MTSFVAWFFWQGIAIIAVVNLLIAVLILASLVLDEYVAKHDN